MLPEQKLTSHISHLTSDNTYAIIVAGGSGSRMQSVVPKQFLLLNGLPVLMHTMNAFQKSRYQPEIILVLPETYHTYWQQLCSKYNFDIAHQIVSGGDTRFQSVKNGLLLVNDAGLVAVHDAVRPLVDTTIIDTAYLQAAKQGSAVVCVQSRDSVRRVVNDKTKSLPRSEIYMVQTPQTFQAKLLKEAYQQPYQDDYTDDASVAEQAGYPIYISKGSHQNFKITFPEDIAIAELLLQKKPHTR